MMIPAELYHQYLGIPADELPASYYRLLGLRAFEDNPKVIEAAADRQMIFLKNHQLGPHAKYVEELLNQVAAARNTLLRPERRAAYDNKLREVLAAQNKPAVGPVRPSRASSVSAAHAPDAAAPEPDDDADLFHGGLPEVPGPTHAPAAAVPPRPAEPELPAFQTDSPAARSKPAVWLSKPAIAGGLTLVLLLLVAAMVILGRGPTTADSDTSDPGDASVVRDNPAAHRGDDQGNTHSGPEQPADGGAATRPQNPAPGNPGANPSVRPTPGDNRPTTNPGSASPAMTELEVIWAIEYREGAQVLIDNQPVTPVRESSTSLYFNVAVGQHVLRLESPQFPTRQVGLRAEPGRRAVLVHVRPGQAPRQPVTNPSQPPQQAGGPTAQPPRPPARSRHEVPSEEDREAALAALTQEHGLDTDLDDGSKRIAADQLLKAAAEPGLEPTSQYVAIQRAAELAGEAADRRTLRRAIDQLERFFDIDRLDFERQVLLNVAQARRPRRGGEAEVGRLLELAYAYTDTALATHRPDLADEVLAAFQPLAVSYRELRVAIHGRRGAVKPLLDRWQAIEAARTRLDEDPDDAQAHEAIGRWLCFVVNDWEAGLPHLAQAATERLGEAAQAELDLPTEPDAQLALADLWWQAAEGEAGDEAQAMRYQAGRWYERALPGIRVIADRLRIQKRLTDIGDIPESKPTSNTPEPPSIAGPPPRQPQGPGSGEPRPGQPMQNSLEMKFVWCPPGTFKMGAPPTEHRDSVRLEAQQDVRITRGFYMGAFEVTQQEYERVMGHNPSTFAARSQPETPRYPVDSVTWNDATEFCRRLSEVPQEKAAGRLYRLPTEAEWEYACRAGTTTKFAFGDGISSHMANFNGNHTTDVTERGPQLARPTVVGSYRPNAWGLYDMHGNISEWCHDVFREDRHNLPNVDPVHQGPGNERVRRGGDWGSMPALLRSASRMGFRPDVRMPYNGFRVVLVQRP